MRAAFRWQIGLLAVLLGVLVLLPVGSLASTATPAGSAKAASVTSPTGFVGSVNWNGANVSTASTTSSALAIQFSQMANLLYSWKSGSLWNINDARLQIFYFGFALATRDVTLQGSTPGHGNNIPLNWTPGAIEYAIEGLYKLTASLVASNGSTVWSETFFVRATAPLSILAVLPIVLIVLAIYELYDVTRSGRQAVLSAKSKKPPTPPSAPMESPSPAAETPPSQDPSSSSSGGTP